MQLSPNFSYEELTASDTATRQGIANTPDALTLSHLRTAAAGMEKVRALLGHPITVSSGYRSPAVNVLVGGVSHPPSAHTLGWAIDFKSPGFGSPLEICRAIEASDIRYDQLIHEFGAWAHISFDPRMRGQELTIGHGTGGYLPGIQHL